MSLAVVPTNPPLRSPCINISNVCAKSEAITTTVMNAASTHPPPRHPETRAHRRASMLELGPPLSYKKARTSLAGGIQEEMPSPIPSSRPAHAIVTQLLSPQSIVEHAENLYGTSKGLMSRIFSVSELQLLSSSGPPSPVLSQRCYLLLKAIVNFEVACLEEDVRGDDDDTNERPAGDSSTARRVAFCGWDGSAARPPVDRVDGSDSHMAAAVDALAKVVHIYSDVSSADAPSLRRFVRNLQASEEAIVTDAARSIGQGDQFLRSRIRDAIKFQQDDMTNTLLRLDLSWTGSFRTLHVEKKLAVLLARSIRFQLRNLLNPAPPRFSPNDFHYEERSQAFSQVKVLVELVSELPPDKISEAVEEKNFATLVSQALETVYAFLGDSVLRQTVVDDSAASRSGTSTVQLREYLDRPRTRRPPPTPELIESLKRHVTAAAQFLACRNAAQFLVDLFRLDVVGTEVLRRGGIERLETYATLMQTFQLHHQDGERSYAHFVLLSDWTTRIGQLETWLNQTEISSEACRNALNDVRADVIRWRRNARDGLDVLITEKLDYVKWMPRVQPAAPINNM